MAIIERSVDQITPWQIADVFAKNLLNLKKEQDLKSQVAASRGRSRSGGRSTASTPLEVSDVLGVLGKKIEKVPTPYSERIGPGGGQFDTSYSRKLAKMNELEQYEAITDAANKYTKDQFTELKEIQYLLGKNQKNLNDSIAAGDVHLARELDIEGKRLRNIKNQVAANIAVNTE